MISLLSPSGSAVNGATAWGSGQLALPVAVAVDASHNAWVANQSSNTITRISADGSKIAQISCCNGASGLAVDQGGNVWVANYFGSSSEVTAVSCTGLGTDAQLGSPFALAIDQSGDLWVTNSNGANTVTVFIGLASPVKTPLLGPPQLP